MSSILALNVASLTKQYRNILAVDRVSFRIHPGEVVGLIGPNGAGKSTIIQMILSLLAPDSGSIEILGKSLSNYREDVLSQMNFAAPYTPLPYNLTPGENLKVFSLLYGTRRKSAEIKQILEEFDLLQFQNEKTGGLSSGEQMRLSIAKSFLNNPKLLLLDEPTSSLDPATARTMRAKILEKIRSMGGSILWTSHNMREVEEVADRIIFLSKGKIIADDTPQGLKQTFNQQDLEELFVAIAHENLQSS